MKRPVLFCLSSRLASKDTNDSVLRNREVGRAKDLSAPGIFSRLLVRISAKIKTIIFPVVFLNISTRKPEQCL